ncbi:nuclear pore complex protein Nup205 isoform X1 [Lampetra fluviatilis]
MAGSSAGSSVNNLWGPYKAVYQAVENAIWKKLPNSFYQLDAVLKKHKADFISLFKNPAKNPLHRERVCRANTDGLAVEGQQGTRIINSDLIEEALILSDLFNMNELSALELLLAGEVQQPDFPTYTRGLVAVMLYWDGKRCIANSLRSLIQARRGKTWTLELSDELVSLTTKFTNELMEEGLTRRILELLDTISFNDEFEKLRKERGLGNERHRKEVGQMIKESRQSLAECLYAWSCQTPLAREDTLLLLEHLERTSLDGDGRLDSVTLTLLVALLYCFDVSVLEQPLEDAEELRRQLPLMDREYVHVVHTRIMDQHEWKVPGLQATVRLAWAAGLRGVSQLPESAALGEYIEADETLVDMALASGVFLFLREAVVGAETFYQEEFYIRRLHTLLADFIVLMPLKVKQLRNRADEEARIVLMNLQLGGEPPATRSELEHLMLLIGEFYSKDPFSLELALEFWCPSEPLQGLNETGSFLGMYQQRPPPRQVSLSRFVRQTGDLLPSSLYVPYLRMLQGLSTGPNCSLYCFNLLKTNGTGQAVENTIQGVNSSAISWEHFFHSLMAYREHLKREASGVDAQPGARPYAPALSLKSVTPREQDGLRAVLRLTATIAQQNESARLSLYEHPQWAPLVTMLGLVQCALPPVLKAELLNTVAAFARSPEIAATLWQAIELAQILQTVKLPSQRQVSGIEMELTEIEARCEEYPLTRAFCTLLSALLDDSVPASLGTGLRSPGFDPYLTFLRETVFLKFPTRAYRDPAEKWQVAELVLQIFHKLLRDYDPRPDDFVEQPVDVQGELVLANKLPGYNLMYHLLNESPMLNLCLSILEEGVRLLDIHVPFPGKASLEGALLSCLSMLHAALRKEGLFMDLLRESHSSVIVTPLEQLLQGINPRSKKPDHIATIARYLCHSATNSPLVAEGAKILCQVCQYPNIQSKLVGDFTHDKSTSQKLLAGFVECLDNEDLEEVALVEEESDLEGIVSKRSGTRIHILNLMLYSLEQKPPNLALFLLGYELRKPVSTTTLQDPGVLGFPRTCLHSILAILNRSVEKNAIPSASPHLTELCYQVVYRLCANSDTSGPTMRYLRTGQDFLYRHLQHLPFQAADGNRILVLTQMSWLLRTVAVELRVTSLNRQRSYTQRLLRLLLDESPFRPGADPEASQEEESRFLSSFFTSGDSSAKVRRKIVSMLDAIDFSQKFPEPMQLDFFDMAQMEQVIMSCEQRGPQGLTVCNIKMLHRILMTEVNTLQGMGALGQRALLLAELRSVLEHVVERNAVRESLHAKRDALEAWRQVVDTILASCPTELLQGDVRLGLITDLLNDLFRKSLAEEAVPELTPVVASMVFTLCTHLSQSLRTEQAGRPLPVQPASQGPTDERSAFVSMLNGTSGLAGLASIGVVSLQDILRSLLNFIMKTSGGMQRVRSSLYGALLYYLQVAQSPMEPDTLQTGKGSMWNTLMAPEDDYSRLRRENAHIINGYGTPLMEVVYRDACDGLEIGRMLAMALLDQVVAIDRQQQWLTFLMTSGYLQVLVESLAQDDATLMGMLVPEPPVLKALYVYESKMAFLTRVARSPQGATELLRAGVIACLAQCRVFSLRPELDPYSLYGGKDRESFIPSMLDRYRQILFSALQLCSTILTSLSQQQQQAASQVIQFLVVHGDAVQSILRCQEFSLGALQELALLVSIICKTALHEFLSVLDFQGNEVALLELKGHLSRIQRQTLGLLLKFCGSDWLRQLKTLDDGAQSNGLSKRDEATLAIQQICANVVDYCRTILTQSGTAPQQMVCLFTPSLAEALQKDGSRRDENPLSVTPAWQLPSLGVLFCLVRQAAEDFTHVHNMHQQSLRKLQGLEQLSADDLRELSQPMLPAGVEKLSTSQRQELAKRRLTRIINHHAELLALHNYTLENSLFVLWRHLEFYCQHCVPVDPCDSYLGASTVQLRPRHLQDPFGHVAKNDQPSSVPLSRITRQDVDQLLSDASICFGDALHKKLQDIESTYGKMRSRYAFVQVLARRIRGLLSLKRA